MTFTKALFALILAAACVSAQVNRATADYIQQGRLISAVDAGTTDAYVACPDVTITTLRLGMLVPFKPATVNTGAASLNLCGLGVKAIKTSIGADPANGDLPAGRWVTLTYDGTNFQMPPVGTGSGGGASLSGTTGAVLTFDGANGVTRNLIGFTNDGTSLRPNGLVLAELAATANIFTGRLAVLGGLAPPSGTTAPSTCTVGDVFFDTDATAGSNWMGCTATNTWVAQGGGGSSSAGSYLAFVKMNGSSEVLDGTNKVLNSASFTLPANTLSAGKCLFIRSAYQKSATSGSVTYQLNYGAAAVVRTFTTSGASARMEGTFCYDANATTVYATSTNDQVGGTASLGQLTTSFTVDATQAQTVSFTANGAATESSTLRMFTVEVLR